MVAKTTMVFDGKTSALNAKLDESRKKAGAVGGEFSKGSAALAGMAIKLGGIAATSAVIERSWAAITRQMERQDQLANKRRGSLDSLAAMTNVFSTPARAQAGKQLGIGIQRQLGLEEEGAAFDIVNKLVSRLGEEAVLGGDVASKFVDAVAATGQRENAVQVIDSVADAMQAFEKDVKDTGNVIGLIAGGAQVSKADFRPFAQALGEMGVQAKLTGTSMEDVVAIFSQLGGEGIERLRTKFNALTGAITALDNLDQIKAQGGLIPFIESLQGMNPAQIRKALGTDRKEAMIAVELIGAVLDKAKAAKPGLMAAKETFIAQSQGRFEAAGGLVGTRLNQAVVNRQLSTEGIIGGDRGANIAAISQNARSLTRIRASEGDFIAGLSDFFGINDSSLVQSYMNFQLRNLSNEAVEQVAVRMAEAVSNKLDGATPVNPMTISGEGR